MTQEEKRVLTRKIDLLEEQVEELEKELKRRDAAVSQLTHGIGTALTMVEQAV